MQDVIVNTGMLHTIANVIQREIISHQVSASSATSNASLLCLCY